MDLSDFCGDRPGYGRTIEHIDSLGHTYEMNLYYYDQCFNGTNWNHLQDYYYVYDSMGHVILTVDSIYFITGTYLRQTETVFDSLGNKILETVVGGNPLQPDSLNRYSFGFNSLQQKTFELFENWNSIASDWDSIQYAAWNYDSLDRVAAIFRSSWSTTDFTFTGYSNDYFNYDTLNNIVEEIGANYYVSSGYDSIRYESIFDSTNLLRIKFYQQWDSTGMSWINKNRLIYEYDSLNRKVVEYYCFCGDTTCSDTMRKTTYEYDSFGHFIHRQSFDYVHDDMWEYTGGDWTYYDANNNIIDQGSSYINFSGCDWHSWTTFSYNSNNQLTHTYSDQGSCNYSSSDCYYYSLNEDSLLLIVNQTPAYCPYDTIQPVITVAGGVPPYNFQWTPTVNMLDSGMASPRIVTDTTINYTLTVTDSNGNSKTQNVHVEVYPKNLFPVTMSTIGVPCEGGQFYITFNSDSLIQPWSMEWYLNGTNAGFPANDTIQALYSGSYSVVLTEYQNYCTLVSDSVQVNLFPEIQANIFSIGDTIVCSGQSVTLSSDSFPSIFWNTGDTTIMITTPSSGNYFVTVIDSNGCTDTSNVISVTVNPLPNVTLGNDTSLCANQSITLDAGGGFVSYLWQDNTTSQTNSASYLNEDSLLLSVTVTDMNFCLNSDSVMVFFNSLPVVTLGNDTSICATQSITLDAGGGFLSYIWQDSSTSQTISATSPIANSILYFIVVTDSNFCSNSDSLAVVFNPLPVVNLGNDTLLCVSQSITLDAGGGFLSYLWQDGTTSQSISVSSVIADTISVSVAIADFNTCANSDTIQVIFDLCAGLSEPLIPEFQIYPNPAEGIVNISVSEMNALNELYFAIYDLLGKQLFIQKIENLYQSFDLGYLNKGVYQFIFTQQGAQLKSGKFVLE